MKLENDELGSAVVTRSILAVESFSFLTRLPNHLASRCLLTHSTIASPSASSHSLTAFVSLSSMFFQILTSEQSEICFSRKLVTHNIQRTNALHIQSRCRLSRTFSTNLLFVRLSLVRTLLLANNQKKICNLEGVEIIHITGVKTCLTPLSLSLHIKIVQNTYLMS
jgi:hypothetical protein